MKAAKILAPVFFVLALLVAVVGGALVVEAKTIQQIQEEIEQYEKEIVRLSAQAGTLTKQISQFNAQIRLTGLKIEETQEKIGLLGGRIDLLEGSLRALSDAFSARANETYKMARLGDPFILLITSQDLSNAVARFHYLQRIQESDRGLLVRLQDAQLTYVGEKTDQESLQIELEDQEQVLGAQKAAKASLLEITRNDEKKYQELLAIARAEFEAIQAIIAGQGEEKKVRQIGQGEKIAAVIQGASCNSSGGHAHFIVRDGQVTKNPFSYLKSGVSHDNCSGSSCGSNDGDPFNPSGSWDWPISPTIKFTQGYGLTWAVRNTWVGSIYRFHNGIDINSTASSDVRAVRPGTLYQGSYTVFNSTNIRHRWFEN